MTLFMNSALLLLPCLSVLFCIADDISDDSVCSDAGGVSDNYVDGNITYLSADLPVVVLDYNQLQSESSKQLESAINIAYGPTGLGLLLVKNVPELAEKRQLLLHFSRQFAYLSDATKSEYEDASSYYSFGYSHGKEMYSKGEPDWRKMSYYGNPLTNRPSDNESLIEKHPTIFGLNVWPDIEKHPMLTGFEQAFMGLGTLVHRTAQLLTRHMDSFVANSYQHSADTDNYNPQTLTQVISSNVPKARLLYYFSDREMQERGYGTDDHDQDQDQDQERRADDWCGWHNDHSALTGLIMGMFFDSSGRELDLDDDAGCGLYLKTRQNVTHHLHLSKQQAQQYMGFQIGESSQILSGGKLVATPHSVQMQGQSDVSRASFAVFMQPYPDHHMRAPTNPGGVEAVQFDRFLPSSVPPLANRWSNKTGDTFGDFTQRTYATYY